MAMTRPEELAMTVLAIFKCEVKQGRMGDFMAKFATAAGPNYLPL